MPVLARIFATYALLASKGGSARVCGMPLRRSPAPPHSLSRRRITAAATAAAVPCTRSAYFRAALSAVHNDARALHCRQRTAQRGRHVALVSRVTCVAARDKRVTTRIDMACAIAYEQHYIVGMYTAHCTLAIVGYRRVTYYHLTIGGE
jgi:hypothetical protein